MREGMGELARDLYDNRVEVINCSARSALTFWPKRTLAEALTGRRCFEGDSHGAVMAAVLSTRVPPPSRARPEVSPALDAVVLRALERDPDKRFATAQEMALALEAACLPAPGPGWACNHC